MTVLDAAAAERGKLRRVLGRMDTVFFLISAMVVVDTIGAIAVGGGETFTWLVVLFVTFFIPSALASAELGAALPEEGGAYVWVRRAFGRYAGALTSLLYWAGTPMWLGGSVARSGKAVHLVDVSARHAQRGVVLADGLFVWPVQQAVHLAAGVVVQLDLAHAELIGPGVAGVIGDLRDGLGGQLQILVKVHESCHDMLLRSM